MLRPIAHAARGACRTISTVVVLAALVTACASSPPPRYYTLGAAAAPTAERSATPAIAVGPVTLPTLVDRPQIVVGDGAHAVRFDDFNRWASPLQDEIARAVADDLTALLANPRVSVAAQNGAADAGYRVAIDIHRFASQPGGSAQLDASWSVLRVRDEALRSGRRAVAEDAPGAYDALAAAHSRALAQLCGDIAAAIRELER